MFWDRAAGVYDLFANVWNKKTHGALARMWKRRFPRAMRCWMCVRDGAADRRHRGEMQTPCRDGFF